MQKYVIANWGAGRQGKSSSIKEVFKLLESQYPTKIHFDNGDIKATIQIGDVLVGLESQGDPDSRIYQSLDDFVQMGCQIIVCATRTRGATVEKVNSLKDLGYQVILTQNDRSDDSTLHKSLNELYGKRVYDFILKIISNL